MEALYLIAALIFAAAGWLAFAREYRAHQLTKGLTPKRGAGGKWVKREASEAA